MKRKELLKWLFTSLIPNTKNKEVNNLYSKAIEQIASGVFTTKMEVINYLYQ